MKLIADSGSTKTHWVLLENNKEVGDFQTIGLNPYFHTRQSITEALERQIISLVPSAVEDIYFYGAGCSSDDTIAVVRDGIQALFTEANVVIEHDLLGAARALLGNNEGIASILGTGSNTCLYDGVNIVQNVRALGFILGDEGSGANIGLRFIKSVLDQDAPEKVIGKFYNEFKLTTDDILDRVYKRPLPNRFLASFASYVCNHKEEEFYHDIIHSSFRAFFNKHIVKYADYQKFSLNVIGSVGYYNQDILMDLCVEYGVPVGRIVKEPIEDLVKFHMN